MLTKSAFDKHRAGIQEKIDRKIEGGQSEDMAKIDKDMDLTFDEHFQFQQTQTWAHTQLIIDTDTAQFIYAALGEVMSSKNGGWSSNVTTGDKVTITKLMQELLGLKIKARRAAKRAV